MEHTKLFVQVQMVPCSLWPEALQLEHETRLQKTSQRPWANHSVFRCQYCTSKRIREHSPPVARLLWEQLFEVLSVQNLWQWDSCRHTEDNRQFLAAISVWFSSTLQKRAENQTEDILFHPGYLERQQSNKLCWVVVWVWLAKKTANGRAHSMWLHPAATSTMLSGHCPGEICQFLFENSLRTHPRKTLKIRNLSTIKNAQE